MEECSENPEKWQPLITYHHHRCRKGRGSVTFLRFAGSLPLVWGQINGTPAGPVYIGRLPQPQVVGRDNPATIDDDQRSTAAGGISFVPINADPGCESHGRAGIGQSDTSYIGPQGTDIADESGR
jgi:hypothetical protein